MLSTHARRFDPTSPCKHDNNGCVREADSQIALRCEAECLNGDGLHENLSLETYFPRMLDAIGGRVVKQTKHDYRGIVIICDDRIAGSRKVAQQCRSRVRGRAVAGTLAEVKAKIDQMLGPAEKS